MCPFGTREQTLLADRAKDPAQGTANYWQPNES
jgi:hypothetical protein